MTSKNRFIIISILGLLSAIAPFSIDMYLPGFPAIAKSLHTNVDRVAYSLSSFFIGICLGQLLCGPLLDRFGRKRPLYVGLVIFLLASVGCIMSSSVEALILFRFLQALGGCVSMVAPRAIIRDIFPVEENAKILSYMILILGVSPIIAPTVGSYIVSGPGWQYVFVVLAIITVIVFALLVFYLPESKQPDPSFSLKPKPILYSFLLVLKNPQFYTYAFTGSFASAGLFAYLSGSPFLFMEYFKITANQYGLVFACIAAGLIGSSQLNTLLLKKYTSEQLVYSTLILQAAAGLGLFICASFGWLNLTNTIVLIFIFFCCQGFNFPNSTALSMAPFTKEAGSASALMGALQMGIGALASALVGVFSDGTGKPLMGVMAGCVVIALLVLILGRKTINSTRDDNAIINQTIKMVKEI